MPGPLPNPNKRRRNAPTISSTELDPRGRRGRVPVCPFELGDAGQVWWAWAWKLPQATRWDDGSLYFVARRALLEDRALELLAPLWREMRELDNRLGLNPKAMADLRWSIGEVEGEAVKESHLASVKPFKLKGESAA